MLILKHADMLWALDPEGHKVEEGKANKMFGRSRLERIEGAGVIVNVVGVKTRRGAGVNVALVHPEGPWARLVCFHHYLVGCQYKVKISDYTHRYLPSLSSNTPTAPHLPEKKTPNSLLNSYASIYSKKPKETSL